MAASVRYKKRGRIGKPLQWQFGEMLGAVEDAKITAAAAFRSLSNAMKHDEVCHFEARTMGISSVATG